ncbi:MAG: mannose-1-phosphate guanylyltransferase [Chloroflexi bacterium]|nr:mannose-1-phosphate guanylyltransferase [Chloroflexota bacterium]
MDNFYAMILAGGGGTRLWPLSRKSMPKQMLALTDERSLFQASIDRLRHMFDPSRIIVVTGRAMVDGLRSDAPHIPAENFIVEPNGRDSAAAVGLGLTHVAARDPDATVAILTSDHHIGRPDLFRSVLSAAANVAQHGHIVTLGITPTYPATGFGYIHQGHRLGDFDGWAAYRSLGFREKPDYETALSFVADGGYSWNSGMFIWTVRKAMQEFERQQHEMYEGLQRIGQAIHTDKYDSVLNDIWDSLPRKSVDFAVMEGAQDIAVIPIDIGWSDVGSWSSLFEVLPHDDDGNCIRGDRGEIILMESHNTLIVSNKLTVAYGVEDLIIVDTPDALLVCSRERAQEIRRVVDRLKTDGQDRYL